MVRTPAKRDESAKKSPSKATPMAEETATAIPSTKITEAKHLVPQASSEELTKTLRKGSGSKAETKNPANLETSFFKKAGVLSAKSKYLTEETLYITIAELMSVPAFVPQVKRSVVRLMPPIKNRRSNSMESNIEDITLRESHARIVVRSSTDSRHKTMMDFDEIHECLKNGSMKWDQITFSKSAMDYLRKHRMLLEQTE